MCVNPLWAFKLPEGGTPKVVPRGTEAVYWNGSAWQASSTPNVRSVAGKPTLRDYFVVGCGHCIECRLQKSREWATRMVLESEYHMHNYFVTLTYDPQHVPVSYFPDPDTGEALPALTLCKADLQKFFKRLRRRLETRGLDPGIRYYAVGEYGDQSHRPHYHAIIFGLDLQDLEPVSKSRLGYQYYRSALLESVWPFGIVTVADVSWQDCAYVARYCTKKLGGDFKDFYTMFNILPEFSVCSNHRGIGYQYFEEHAKEFYELDEIFLSLPEGGKKVKPPHYYDALYAQIEEATMAAIKERRKRYAESAERVQRRSSGLTDDERLQARAELLMRRAQALIRPDC